MINAAVIIIPIIHIQNVYVVQLLSLEFLPKAFPSLAIMTEFVIHLSKISLNRFGSQRER